MFNPWAGDIGEPQKWIELEPLEVPATTPAVEPVTVPAEPEKVPA